MLFCLILGGECGVKISVGGDVVFLCGKCYKNGRKTDCICMDIKIKLIFNKQIVIL